MGGKNGFGGGESGDGIEKGRGDGTVGDAKPASRRQAAKRHQRSEFEGNSRRGSQKDRGGEERNNIAIGRKTHGRGEHGGRGSEQAQFEDLNFRASSSGSQRRGG